ncbi:MAG: autotransporter outer membrane beta-barrel domain-containing protein, partial [Alphaproteobacteria bacterium]|nr:autotransporter outer membrane beta-barrel domain-containing protein [Alphaproteobacteria bacterium]
IDGAIQTHTFAGKFAIISEVGGLPQNVANFAVDLDAQKFVSDQFVFSGMAMPGDLVANGNGQEIANTLAVDAIVNLSQLNLINSPTTSVVPFNILSSPNYDPSLVFTAFSGLVNTPAGLYELVSLGEGNYELHLVSSNPQTGRGSVATHSMLLSQMQVTNIMFDHVFLDSNECFGCGYAPWQFSMHQKGVWAKGYGGADKLKFGHGLDTVDNNLYGVIAGLDFESVRLGHDKNWTWLPTLYMAYNGGNQKFNDIEMTQNGAQIGMQNTWSDGDWIAAILTYGGFYNNRIEIGNTTDSVNNWFIGAGGKVAYDWRFYPENIIIQPNLLVSYNYFGSQTWTSNYGDAVIDAGYLNGLNVAPGLAVITGITDTVNLFVSGIYNRNFTNNSTNRIGEMDSPNLNFPEWYFEYGIGAVGSIKETITLDAKISLRTGDNLNGFIGRIGLSYRF